VPSRMRVPRGLAPLRHRGFRLLVTGQLASNVGDSFYAVALPWYVLASHGGALLLATVLAAYGIPRTVLVAVGGHASDRWQPWRVMMSADAVRAIAVAVLAVAAFTGPPNPAVLIPIAVVIGAGEGLFLPGSFSIIPALLPDSDLQAGNSVAFAGTELAALAGPAIGGGIVALAGPAAAFVADAATFVISAATLAGVTVVQQARRGQPAAVPAAGPAGPADPAGPSTSPDVDETQTPPRQLPPTLWRLIRSDRALQIILLVTLAANLGSGGLGDVALPALAHGPFHAGAAGYGGLIAAIGAGALIGTIAAGQSHRFRRPALVASAAFLIEAVFMAIVPYLGSAIPAAVALALFGGLNGFGNVLAVTAVQRWAPPELLGRLMGLVLLASFGIFPVSVVLGGLVVHDFGPAPFFPAAAAALAVAVLGGLTQRTWREFGVSAPEDGADAPGALAQAPDQDASAAAPA
jgi:predicted MFS family arabinose efflux permease